jgi:hypothetical protein
METGLSYEEYLDKYQRLVRTNVGVSMLPLLRQGRDLFVVEKRGPGRLKAGDVVLYRRPPDKYVLHRIVEVREKDYVILGDNCVNREYGITDDDILGIMTGFVRDGKQHTVTERGYRLYSFLQLHGGPVRVFFKKVGWRVKAGIKKALGIGRTKV